MVMAASLSIYKYIWLISIIFFIVSIKTGASKDLIVQLLPNQEVDKDNNAAFVIYCFENVPKSFLQIWRSVQVCFERAPSSYELFTGENPSEVSMKSNEQSTVWSPSSWFLGQKTAVEFPAFSNHCVGVVSKEHYAVSLKVRVVNYWRVLQTLLGIILFISAPSLSRNSFFHYTTGVSVGVMASLLILIYIISRFIPKRSASYTVLLFGYSFVLYLLRVVWQHFNYITTDYRDVLLVYCLCAAFVSFVICYRLGPVQNVRTFNIIQWFMQAVAVVLIYLSSEYREVSAALNIVLFTVRIIPASWISRFQSIWLRFFPPKVRLLTEVEYIEQGSVETAKALQELRKFCSSPDCNTWRMVRQLRDPVRFSKFVESGSHYTDDELLSYNREDLDDDKPEEFEPNGCGSSSTHHLSFR